MYSVCTTIDVYIYIHIWAVVTCIKHCCYILAHAGTHTSTIHIICPITHQLDDQATKYNT